MPLTPFSPPVRKGFRWVLRSGCVCSTCPWGENCIGRTWRHWIEVKDGHRAGNVDERTSQLGSEAKA